MHSVNSSRNGERIYITGQNQNFFNSSAEEVAIKVAGYAGGITLVGVGGAICTVPIPGVQVLGAFLILSGVSTVGATACRTECQNRRFEEANTHHEALNIEQTVQIENLRDQNIQYQSLNQDNKKNIILLEEQVQGLTKNQERNLEIIKELESVAAKLNEGVKSYVTNIEQQNKDASLNQAEFKKNLDLFSKLIQSLEGESAKLFSIFAQQFQEVTSKVFEVLTIEEKLRETYQNFYRMEGRLLELQKRYEAIDESLRSQVTKLKNEILELEQIKMKLQELILAGQDNTEIFQQELKKFSTLITSFSDNDSTDKKI